MAVNSSAMSKSVENQSLEQILMKMTAPPLCSVITGYNELKFTWSGSRDFGILIKTLKLQIGGLYTRAQVGKVMLESGN